jgi:hypothetical protein
MVEWLGCLLVVAFALYTNPAACLGRTRRLNKGATTECHANSSARPQ